MAVKLSSGLWLMNNEIANIISDNRREYYLKDDDKEGLRKLREEYYDLTKDSHFRNDPEAVVSGPNVYIKGLATEVMVSSDEDRLYELFEDVSDILKKYFVDTDIYRSLKEVFEQMDRIPKEDTKNAIEHIIKTSRHVTGMSGILEGTVYWNSRKEQLQTG